MDQPFNAFNNDDVVFFSSKYIVESSKLHFAIAYTNVINDKNFNKEFDVTYFPECVTHCVYLTSGDSAKLFKISNIDIENNTFYASENNKPGSNNEEDL
ncbi:25792_t:CDS:2 [Gigaspora margarita]|uniref:25792_t:CDS:1 n=1 Tax=Gigaspora margarita TaxID=4874 RepID=A0ABN7W501_GIGMA|nr:25792_t:CDS:2 [Gigaspora margarita]